jgi:predicted transposase/invertase (TIGR01784 family)
MADEIHHPHDMMVHAVLRDLPEATSFLQAYLAEDVSQRLNWSTLRLLEGSFVDEELRGSEADFLYEIEHVSGEESVWLYMLVEHQSTPDRWMRFRLLKYCCRIWDQSFRDQPNQRELRAIVPLVFYQGERSWSYSSEFADLFAESVRDGPGVPRFSHGLIDQSGMRPEEVQGELKARLMQLLLMAAYHPTLAWMEQVARLLVSLSSLPPSGGINYVRIFVLYILETQEPEAAQLFREVLRLHAPSVGEDLMTTYAQELLAEGRAEGRAEGEQQGAIKTQVEVIEGFLREGVGWPVIERATGVNEAQFQALKQQVEAMNE